MFQAKVYNADWIDSNKLVFPLPVEIYNNFIPPFIYRNNCIKVLCIFSEPEPFRVSNADVIKNQHLFDLILTYDEEILNSCKNSKLFALGTTWIHPSFYKNIDINKKKFEVSFLCGAKNVTEGHKLRQKLWYRQKEIKIPKTFWISGQLPIESVDNNPILPSDWKNKILMFDSMFHIAIENVKINNYFTEKIIDCLVTKTIPIYWGCPNIENFFDIRGMYLVGDEEEIIYICNNLNPDDYYNRIRYINDNYNLCLNYCEEITMRLQNIINETFFKEKNYILNLNGNGESVDIMKRDYFVQKGDLIFDVGAFVGSKTDNFLYKNAKVVCIEPQPKYVQELCRKYKDNPNVIIVEKGLSDKPGRMKLLICSEAPAISTFSKKWLKERFSNYKWDQSIEVEISTLDEIIQQYGTPKYCKIDMWGFEYEVLKGLSKPLPYLSFKFTIEFIEDAKKCIELLKNLGYKYFNYIYGEKNEFSISYWVTSEKLFEYLEQSKDENLWGDIYAKYVPSLLPYKDATSQLKESGLWRESQPLRLHLGCGEQHLEGYVNIDYPPSEHNVMKVKADIYADILTLDFPPGSIDEIRLHHVFEHFNRVTALAMLIRWHKWLKIGGKLWIETPDLIGSAKTLLSDTTLRIKTAVVRHLAGDQAASWAYHIDHWFPERFEHTLSKLGFDSVQTQSISWQHEPYLSNVHAIALKVRELTLDELLRTAEDLLWESTVSDTEKPIYKIWCSQLREMVLNKTITKGFEPIQINNIIDASNVLKQSASILSLHDIHDFNQRNRDRWVQAKARTVPAGSRVLDVGAGTCPYRSLFSHCDYKTHDFKKYTGIKLDGTTEYGPIDYESDITDIPVPDSSFDVILCTEVLEHVPEPIKAIQEISRILKPGGRLFLTAPLSSGLHQLPYHFYGGFTPEWYKYFLPKFGLQIIEITPNGGFFKLLAQECARLAWTFDKHKHLHGEHADFIHKLFNELLPSYLFALDEKCFINQFTVGYHIEAIKSPSKGNISEEVQLLENLQKDFKDVQTIVRLAEIEIENSNYKKARNLLIATLALDPENITAKKLLEKLNNG